MNTNKKLNEVTPREQSGALTAEQYEYQYTKTAEACFGLLEASESICVFCEWHDDFVTEYENSRIGIYAFHQVKIKALNRGPWTITEIFGTGKAGLNTDCPFFRMAENHKIFRGHCKSFVFITNNGIKLEISNFLDVLAKAPNYSDLKGKDEKLFSKLWKLYRIPLAEYDENDFFILLKSFKIEPESGNLGEHTNILRTQIQDKVKEFCEFNLNGNQTKRITTNLIEMIRQKAQNRIKTIPIDEASLKARKAIKSTDILDLLPLSKDGLKALQSGRDDLKQNIIILSRLQRLCKKSGIDEKYIKVICDLKVSWDIWYLNKQHQFEDKDLSSIKYECTKALTEESGIDELDAKADQIVKLLNPKISKQTQLTKELVIGFIFSLAAQMEIDDE